MVRRVLYTFSPDLSLPEPVPDSILAWVREHGTRAIWDPNEPEFIPGRLTLCYEDGALSSAEFLMQGHQEVFHFGPLGVTNSLHPLLTETEERERVSDTFIDKDRLEYGTPHQRAVFEIMYVYPASGPETAFFARSKSQTLIEIWKESDDVWIHYVVDIDAPQIVDEKVVTSYPDKAVRVPLPLTSDGAPVEKADPLQFATKLVLRMHPGLTEGEVFGRMAKKDRAEIYGTIDGRWRRYDICLDGIQGTWEYVFGPRKGLERVYPA